MSKISALNKFFPTGEFQDVFISGVTDDSRCVLPGYIFIARMGVTCHGLEFADEAIASGAIGILSDKPCSNNANFPYIYDKDLKAKTVPFLFEFYDLEQQDFIFFGVTGSNGKTSTTYLAHQLARKLKQNSCCIGTLGAIVNDELYQTKGNTTPGVCELFSILAMVNTSNETFVFLELSSHALYQKRLEGLTFFQTILLNIQSDHLDYHKSLERYAQAKLMLLDIPCRYPTIINIDCKSIQANLDISQSDYEYSPFSSNSATAIFYADISSDDSSASKIVLNYPTFTATLNSELFPKFNLLNLASAVALLHQYLDREMLEDLQSDEIQLPPGRSQLIKSNNGNIFIDFAHDDTSMENILTELQMDGLEIVLIFGCGGERDRSKRPKMMKVANSFAFHTIFTSDNSRGELFSFILGDATEGQIYPNMQVIEDREEAIKTGLKKLKKGRLLVILGKGHETFIEIDKRKIPFNDYDCVMNNLSV